MLSKNVIKQSLLGPGLMLMVPAAKPYTEMNHTLPYTKVSAKFSLQPHFTAAAKTVSFDSTESKTMVAKTVSLNKQASKYATAFIKKEDEFLQKMKRRSNTYFNSIETALTKYGVPQQLKYLAIVESELTPTAKSRVGARGLWQLMPGTARELGLKVSGKNDERIQTYRSTVAAAKYLRDLHNEFGDWLLVLSAYNSGPVTVYKAIKKAGSKNFWAIQRFLPAETRGHVKRFISIHYFFEGEGSIATQTKAEAKAYADTVGIEKQLL